MATIAHIDLDSFFASCEAVRDPDIADSPIIICMYSGRGEDGGAVSTANYAARDHGIHAGMSIQVAKERAAGTDAVFLPADKEYYKTVSNRIMERISDHVTDIEAASIDEAYIDLSDAESYDDAAARVAAIRTEIREQEQITASAGIAPNKFVAKMASDHNKPDGQTVVRDDEAAAFLADMPVGEMHGVGPKTAETLQQLGVTTIEDVQEMSVQQLIRKLGDSRGTQIYRHAQGGGETTLSETEKKQLSRLTTLPENTRDMTVIRPVIRELSYDVANRVEEQGKQYACVAALFVTTERDMRSKRVSLKAPTDRAETVFRTAERLTEAFLEEYPDTVIRRAGVRVSDLSAANQQSLTDF